MSLGIESYLSILLSYPGYEFYKDEDKDIAEGMAEHVMINEIGMQSHMVLYSDNTKKVYSEVDEDNTDILVLYKHPAM